MTNRAENPDYTTLQPAQPDSQLADAGVARSATETPTESIAAGEALCVAVGERTHPVLRLDGLCTWLAGGCPRVVVYLRLLLCAGFLFFVFVFIVAGRTGVLFSYASECDLL